MVRSFLNEGWMAWNGGGGAGGGHDAQSGGGEDRGVPEAVCGARGCVGAEVRGG